MKIFSEEQLLKCKIAASGYKLYLDMDGVLTAFDEYFEKKIGVTTKEYNKKHTDQEFWKLIGSYPNWFRDLPIKEGATKLWEYVKDFNPIILTTPGGNIKECKIQKREWINEYFGKEVPIIFSNKKYEYASSNSILIDDMEYNITPWIEHDGIGILYKNVNDAILQLKKVI